MDADSDFNARWMSIKNITAKQNYSLPSNISTNGLIEKNDSNIQLGIWIMPNNQSTGYLEDFIQNLIPKEYKLMPIANEVLKNIETKNLNLYQPIHHAKALIHTWLAWQKVPGLPFGTAINSELLVSKSANSKNFSNWLSNLFKLKIII